MHQKILSVSVSALMLGLVGQASAQLGSGGGGDLSAASDSSPPKFTVDTNQDGLLNVADFTTFTKLYALGSPLANCDGSTATPTLNVADFTCYLQAYATAAAAMNQNAPAGTQDHLGDVAAARPKTPAGIATNSTSLTATSISGQ
jgi:hypothetical protein